MQRQSKSLLRGRAAAVCVVMWTMLAAGATADGLGPPPASKLKKTAEKEPRKVIALGEKPASLRTVGVGVDLASLHAQAVSAANAGSMSPITDALILLLMEMRFEAEEAARVKNEEAGAETWSRRWYPPSLPATAPASTNRSP